MTVPEATDRTPDAPPDEVYETAAKAWAVGHPTVHLPNLIQHDALRRMVDAVWSHAEELRRRHIAETVRELVALATDPDGPTAEWLVLVKDVSDGKYTPPEPS